MNGRVDRRRMLAAAVATVANLGFTPGLACTEEVRTHDSCYWRRDQRPCSRSGHDLEEDWCWRCCDIEAGCTVIRCEWRVVGTC